MATEKRLIDANALYEFLTEQREKETGVYSKGRNNGISVAISAIRNEEICPTVDAVEVVRCKDCKHFVQGEPYDPCECMKWMVKFGVAYTTPDGYCHKAERKDNG